MVQRGPARRQPGTDRAHEPCRKAGVFPDAGEDRLQRDRGGLPCCQRDRVRVPAHPDREEHDPRGRDRAGADPVPRPHHPQDLRGRQGCAPRGDPLLQLHLCGPARAGVPQEQGRDQEDRHRRRKAGQAAEPGVRGQLPVRVQPRELYRHRGGLRRGRVQRRSGHHAAHP